MLVEKYGLLGVVENLSRGGGDGAVLVRELAREIVPVLKPGLKPAALKGRDSPKTVAPKKLMRRTASDGSTTMTTSSNFQGTASTARAGVARRPRLGDVMWQSESQNR